MKWFLQVWPWAALSAGVGLVGAAAWSVAGWEAAAVWGGVSLLALFGLEFFTE